MNFSHIQQALLPQKPSQLIGGKWVAGGESTDVLNPSDESVLCQVVEGTRAQADAAVDAARSAFRPWARKTLIERAEYLRTLRGLVEKNAEALAYLLSYEQGKVLHEARDEVKMAIAMLDFHIGLGFRQVGAVLASMRPEHTAQTREEPRGVVAAIIPWNFPLALFVRKMAPATLAGNTVIVKPAEVTPLCSLAMGTLCLEAGFPAGVVNVITGQGREVGNAMVVHPDVAMVTMTGSTRGGTQILMDAAKKVIPVSLELGGKAPFIVMDDADIAKAARDAVAQRMINCGQVCTCNERTYVQRGAYDKFLAALKDELSKVKVGNPLDASSTVGPKVSSGERDHVMEFISKAHEEGGKFLLGGEPLKGQQFEKGYWVPPTVVTDLPQDSYLVKNEVFGPVLPVLAFDKYEEVIEQSNAIEYGLSSYVYTSNLRTAMRFCDDLEYGEVYINRVGPEELNGYHAGWKKSGMGGDDGELAYKLYTRPKTLYIDYSGS